MLFLRRGLQIKFGGIKLRFRSFSSGIVQIAKCPYSVGCVVAIRSVLTWTALSLLLMELFSEMRYGRTAGQQASS